MATKFTALLIAAGFGAALLAARPRPIRLLLCGAVAIIAGGQWYAWNWWHTGDPVFPLLYGVIEYAPHVPWDSAHSTAVAAMFANEMGTDRDLMGLIAYPFMAMLSGDPVFEGGRVGLGPFAVLIAPFAAAGAWRFRARVWRSPLLAAALVVVIFYVLWFFFGPSQRVRHMVPVYPLAVLCFTVAAARWASRPRLQYPLAAAAGLALLVQMGGQALYSINYVRHLIGGESRDAFLERNVSLYPVVRWTNSNLPDESKVLMPFRQLIYLVRHEVFYAHGPDEARIDLTTAATDAGRLYRQMMQQHITHAVVPRSQFSISGRTGLDLWPELVSAGCAEVIAALEMSHISSRSLALSQGAQQIKVLRLAGPSCEIGG